MKVTIEELEKFKVYIARAIHNRSDGELYIPIFQRLEREVNERQRGIETMARIQAIANKQ